MTRWSFSVENAQGRIEIDDIKLVKTACKLHALLYITQNI